MEREELLKRVAKQMNAYCVLCSAKIPIYDLMCADCKKKFPAKAALIRQCGECGKPYFVKEPALEGGK